MQRTPPDPPIIPPGAGRWYRIWRVVRYLLAAGIVALAVWALSGKAGELSGASTYLAHLRWWWVLVAALAEAVSYVSYGALQRRLLAAGGTQVSLGPMTGLSFAGNAIQSSLPAGIVLAAAYAFRQYRRFGADEVLAGWVMVAMTAVSFIALTALAAAGLVLATGAGSALDLLEVIPAIAAFAGLLVVAWLKRAWLLRKAAALARVLERRLTRGKPRQPDPVKGWLDRLSAISPGRTDWAWASTFSLGNWISDCSCLVLSFMAVGAGVPWRGILLAYGAAQLASSLPITPGGLGVVEGSLTIALVAFGGGEASTVAAVLVYRVLSFWVTLPIGWGAWAVLAAAGRRQAARAGGPEANGAAPRELAAAIEAKPDGEATPVRKVP